MFWARRPLFVLQCRRSVAVGRVVRRGGCDLLLSQAWEAFMSERSVRVHEMGRFVRPMFIGVLLAVVTAGRADEMGTRPISWEPRVPAGKCLSDSGSLLSNQRPGQAWQAIGDKEEVHSRDLLLALPGTRAVLETTPKAIELTLWGNLPELSGFSGLESAVILHDSRAFDLDFTLQRGRAILTNRKEKGSAVVWVRIEGAAFRLTLNEPGDSICLGLYSFWPRGVPFAAAPKSQDVPARSLTFIALKGQIDVKAGGTQHPLGAPPGPAYFHWDSDNGADEGTKKRDRIPDWANPNSAPPAKAILKVIAEYRDQAKDKEPDTALLDLLTASAKEREKERAAEMAEFAVFGLAAINDMDRLLQALDDPKNDAARQTAVTALQHWIGDVAGRDARLVQYLMDRRRYSKAQATTMLHLLHDAFAVNEPETYETLIAYLRHEHLAIRELAWRHLKRLTPEGVSVPYDPAGSDAERARAYAAWKELIPSGTVPMKKPKK